MRGVVDYQIGEHTMKKVSIIALVLLLLVACSGADEVASRPTEVATSAPSPTEAVITDPTAAPTASESDATPVEMPVEEGTDSTETVPPITACNAFLDNTTIHCEADTAFVESDGLPTTHDMMVGIVSWQQQVPLPQAYTGDNAWQIPLAPELSDNPISGANDLFRGAIAVNGVPIFNALNNRGDDAYLAGELDQWGGHSGRGDDYHYHIAPTHLQDIVGIDQPIAYALDGFPIYGLTEPDGSPVVGLDEYNGHFDDDGNYHYHATETYPYINGGLRGVVDYQNGQVEPQPQALPVRPAGEPLPGAEVTAFSQTGSNAYSLQYTLNNETYTVNYTVENETYTFEFIDPAGNSTVETYTP
ncbi:MAG: YHYH protein [Chloroflexi bacterium AL-W]|nr:YHYH protein [Chloroflexi bacterium AL-N1]NOK68815.1 YHYH protein [Chloroflexi bacterium AL-N10]NOK76301.1 YHYH protein [Chloroflexi bacterium AL-N5]NOK84062.1 YHYH protein [Chloroflexi bacterium AL-W]NOK91439.1 YHYH protein [Chloroflexi bacterium AL-N15]